MNYKVKCTGYRKSERYFTVGKVYDVIDNTITNDNGHTYGKLFTHEDVIAYLSEYYTFERVCNKKIVITSDGKETLARLYEGNKVVKTATAKCSPDDTFDFETGAKIAYDRLMEETKAEEKEWRVVDRPVKVGDYIRLIKKDFSFDEIGDVLKVDEVTKFGSAKVYGNNPTRKRPTADEGENWLYFREEFEVVEPATEKKEEPKCYNGKVVCVSNENKPYRAVGGFTVGKVYTITDGIITNDTGWNNPIPLDNTLEAVCACLGNKFVPFVE